jgi:farnesyl-diphosphate farnesyltransferase
VTIPGDEIGSRRFLVRAALLAASTLGKILARPLFTTADEVKVSRRTVTTTMMLSNAAIRRKLWLTKLINAASCGLPLLGGNGSSPDAGKEIKTS